MNLQEKIKELISEFGLEAVKQEINKTNTDPFCGEGMHWDDVLKKCVEDVG